MSTAPFFSADADWLKSLGLIIPSAITAERVALSGRLVVQRRKLRERLGIPQPSSFDALAAEGQRVWRATGHMAQSR